MKILAGKVVASFAFLTQPVYVLPQADVDAVAQNLIGIMDTAAQAAQSADIPSVRMITCTVTVEGADGRFLYQEQALKRNLNQPYRQRFLPKILGLKPRPLRQAQGKPYRTAFIQIMLSL